MAGRWREVVGPTQRLLDEGMMPAAIIEEGLRPAMVEVGNGFACGEFYLPEMLLAAKAMKMATDYLLPHLRGRGQPTAMGTVVIGTVKGDLHDIGKNLVIAMLEGAGYKIVDLGIDVPAEKFIAAIREHSPQIVAFSALLSTTLANIPDIIREIEAAGLRQGRLLAVGGAPVTEDYARRHGIELYAPDAGTAVQVFNQALAAVG
jgi:5-methyltetrahydrofolate--homocysteine methyltransferase